MGFGWKSRRLLASLTTRAGTPTASYARGQVMADHRAGTDDRLDADRQARQDLRPSPNERARPDPHPPRQRGGGHDVGGFFHHALVIDNGGRVDDRQIADGASVPSTAPAR